MYIPILLAHGALGNWDELVFLGVAAIFLTMMGISWIKSRNSTPSLDQSTKAVIPDSESPDHFPLE